MNSGKELQKLRKNYRRESMPMHHISGPYMSLQGLLILERISHSTEVYLLFWDTLLTTVFRKDWRGTREEWRTVSRFHSHIKLRWILACINQGTSSRMNKYSKSTQYILKEKVIVFAFGRQLC